MADTDPANPNTGTTIGDVAGDISRALIAGRDIIGNLLITGDHNQVFANGYERLADAYIKPQEVFDRVHLEHFTGREWLLAAVDAFLQDHDCGYFILEADAGLGKTAFMAWLVRQRNYVHHFSELAPGPEGVQPALKSLAAQLALAYKLKPEGVLPAAASRPDYLYDLLCQAAQHRRPGEKVVLVVDALDQAGTPLNQNVLGLPSLLPPGVCVIVSQRPISVTLQIKASHTPRVPYLLAAESDDNQADMRRFLTIAAAWPGIAQMLLADGYTLDQFVAALLAKSRGLWIYLHYVVAQLELDAKGKGAGHLDLRLDRLPDGLTQYYIRYWQAWRDTDEDKWYNLYLPLLATLAAAQEAVTLDRLLAWVGLSAAPPGLPRLFSERWRPFLIMVGQGQVARYRFYHATLPEFFAGQSDKTALTTAEQSLVAELAEATRAAHDRLAERYLQAWGGLDGVLLGLLDARTRDLDERYGLRYAGAHLAEAGRAADLHHLLRIEWVRDKQEIAPDKGKDGFDKFAAARQQSPSAAYQNAWRAVLEAVGLTDGYLADVTRAWHLAEMQAAERISLIAQERIEVTPVQSSAIALQCRYALIVATLNSLAENVLPGLLAELLKKNIWLPQQGLAYARQVPNTHQRVQALTGVASNLSPGDREQVLQEASQTAQGIEDSPTRARVLAGMASSLAEQGQIQEALRIAREIEPNLSQAQVLADVALRVAEQGQLEDALRIAHGIEDSRFCVQALARVSPHFYSIDERVQVLHDALRIAQGIESRSSRSQALADVASRLAEQGQLQDALRIAQGIESRSSRAQALADVASGLAERGQLQEALLTAQGLEDGYVRARALADVASCLAEQGQSQEALRIIQGIEYRSSRVHALAGVASCLAGEGQLQEAVSIVQDIEPRSSRAQALADVASRLAEKGHLHEALRVAQDIESRSFRTRAMAGVALCLAEQGQLQNALLIAQGIESRSSRAQALADVAPHLSAELLQEALLIAQGIEDGPARARALSDVALHLAEEGQLQDALRIAQGIESRSLRAQALTDVASCLAEKGHVQDALRIAQNIEYRSYQAQALVTVAPHLSAGECGLVLQDALRIAQNIKDSYFRAQALAGVASRFAAEGQLQDTLRIAEDIEDNRLRAGLLADVVPHLAAEQLQEALLIAQSIEDARSRARALAGVALRLAEEGQLHDALRIAQGIESNSARARALSDVALCLAEEGQLQDALRIAQGIEPNSARARALADVAPLMAKLGQLQGALLLARNIEDGYSRAQALANVAPHLPVGERKQVLQEALRIAKGIASRSARAQALAGVASLLAQEGQLQEGLRIAQEIESSYSRANALADVASSLAEQGQPQAALHIAHSIEDSRFRAQALAAVSRKLAELPPDHLHTYWCQALLNSSGRNRSDFLTDLASMLAVVTRLGGTSATSEIAQAIQDVGRWWQ